MNRKANPRSFWIAASLVACCLGCGESDSSQIEQLIKNQQQQESAKLKKEQTLEQQLVQARAALERRSAQRAIDITMPLLVKFPKNVELLFLTAEAKASLGDKLAAVELLESIHSDLTKDSSSDEANNAKRAVMQAATWLTEVGRSDLAIDSLVAHLAIVPDHHRARHRLVSLLNNSGRRIEAAKEVQFLLQHDRVTEKELFSMTTLGDAFIDESMPPPNLRELNPTALAMARRLRNQDELEQAIRLTQSLTESFPESTPIAAFFGKLLAELGQFDRLTDWRTSLPVGIEREPEYWHALGKLSNHLQDHRAAVRCFGETLQRDPTDRDALLGLAQALRFLDKDQQMELALAQFNRLEETEALAKKFGRTKGTVQQYGRMADLMEELHRPWEAMGWRVIGIDRTEDVENQLETIEHRRRELQAQHSITTSPPALIGIDLLQWPLPATSMNNADIERLDQPSVESLSQPIRLKDVARQSGMTFQYLNGDNVNDKEYFLHQQTGGGIGIIDMDLDGWPDVYFTQAGGPAFDNNGSEANQMFRNLGGQSFRSVAVASGCDDKGYGQGAAVADINQDGFPDLLVANIGVNVLLMNNGDGSFSRRALPTNGDGQWTTSIACGDLNGDHLPEIIEVNYIDDDSAFQIACVPENDECAPSQFHPASARWLSVDRQGEVHLFDGSSAKESTTGHGFAAIIANIDNHAGNDLYIANDGDPNQYWVSRTESENRYILEESAFLLGCATSQQGGHHGSMGLAFGDFDRNGQFDMHVTNYWDQEADLYLQQSGGIFQHASRLWQIRESTKLTVGWGTQAADLNRDGWLDLLVLNGHLVDHTHRSIPFRMLPQLFEGHPDRFELALDSESSDSFLSNPSLGRTLALLDWNRDGRPDFVAGHLDQPVSLLENHTDAQNWVQFQFIGTTSERDAIGTTVNIVSGKNQWTGWLVGGSFLCSNEAVVDFGIGRLEQLTEITIRWPSGVQQSIRDVPANQRYLIVEGQPNAFALSGQ
jgi:tetratricopeptide (TPR) repeat protein